MAYVESRKNLTGSACGIAGLALTFTGLAGAYWPVVIAGLYGAGALIAPPERPPAPDFPDPSSQLETVRADFATLRDYLAEVELPPAAAGRLAELTELLEGLLAPGWVSEALAADPEAIHALSRAVHQDIPESVDTYLRTRWWTRLTPGTEPPERPLEQQLSLLHREAESLAARLREAEARRQQTHTRYLEDRGRAN
ncbi:MULTISPECIES: hypothetical protein [unclassified Streptomyces]|uniref:hypothetical protein n=1 Tax=unclassified Streptomyces TaxID=2593676 RepID=UPI002E804AC8|nr:hypothetical protein [Streptomyces sp. NBC_00562]WTC84876.1 hypothetical protein OH719_20220 [Streptomyces sp. NBC_01653]WTD39172.1 hypothetical protein OHB03_26395 [Streptomyces sp. NBC_01643]WTD94600.1 hypothetical protein OG891_26660 [Streptomyces sp. NBC_01637]WUC25550.1 hypothetical protein OHA33_24995 [Streptomyces sp. NBC_00562]